MGNDDPRIRRFGAWEAGLGLYPVEVLGVAPGTELLVGTNYPAPHGVDGGKPQKHSYVARLVTKTELTAREVVRLALGAYRAAVAQGKENAAVDAMQALGGGDHPQSLPRIDARMNEAYCFWYRMVEHPRPVLAFKTHFESKTLLKSIFDKLYKEGDGKDAQVRTGWDKDAKLWWFYGEWAYPRLLGQMRAYGWRLKWIERPGLPPSPPIEAQVETDLLNDTGRMLELLITNLQSMDAFNNMLIDGPVELRALVADAVKQVEKWRAGIGMVAEHGAWRKR